jgi:glycyl-tRNA synthetase beta chain
MSPTRQTLAASLKRAPDGKAEAFFYDSLVTGATLDIGLQKALDEAIAKLPIPKVMSYQLETDCELPGWSSVNFVRPAHSLVALHGTTVGTGQGAGPERGPHHARPSFRGRGLAGGNCQR